ELRLSELLDEYRQLREERLKDETKRKQAAAGLLVCGLQQRLLSSIEAFARTLRVHRRTIERQMEEPSASLATRAGSFDLMGEGVSSDDDRATLPEEELEAEEEAQFEAATLASATEIKDASEKRHFAREQQLLDEITAIAEKARSLPDARIRKLVDWIRANM